MPKQPAIPPPVFDPSDILPPETLAQRLHVKTGWVYSMIRKRDPDGLPVLRMGRYLRFSWTAVSGWLARRPSTKPYRKRGPRKKKAA